MFARRHPYLFFILAFTAISATTMVVLSLVIMLGTRDTDFEFGQKVGIIEVNGVIGESTEVLRALKRFRESEGIRAIILRINSPGGGVGPSQEIFREVRRTAAVKKVVASMGSVAASGGYYIAAGADGIMANPGTITGSIGVIMGYTNFKEIIEKIGLVPVVFKSGEYKDMGSPVRSMTETEKKILQEFVDKIHAQFVGDVAQGRNMPLAQVKQIADGRIYTGEQAKALGLVDRLGNLEDAIEWAGRLGGIEGKIQTVYAPKARFSLLELFLGESLEQVLERTMHAEFKAEYR